MIRKACGMFSKKMCGVIWYPGDVVLRSYRVAKFDPWVLRRDPYTTGAKV